MMLDDLKLALRGFGRTPGFAAACVLTLAVGVGANTAIFSVVDGVLLRPLPYEDPDRLVILEIRRADGSVTGSVSVPDFRDFRRDNQVFTDLAATRPQSFVRSGDGEPEKMRGLVVSPNLFSTLGRAPALGRGFTAEEGVAGKNHVVVLGHAAWQRSFHGDPDIIGRSIVLDDEPYTVVGVLGPDFRLVTYTLPIDLMVPTPNGIDARFADQRGARFFTVVGRLKPGAGVAAGQANLDALFRSYASLSPEDYDGQSMLVSSLHARLTRDVRPALLLLLGVVGLVLLIACANVASLLLTRANGRQRELAIRVALGADRARLVRQLMTESLLLAAFGGALGVGLAVWGLEALRAWLPPEIARFNALAVDLRVLAFTAGATLLTALIFGLWPALSASRADSGEALRHAAARGSGSRPAQSRARAAIVAAQVAFATLLLVGSTLMLRSFQQVTARSPGFTPDDLVVGAMNLPPSRYPDDPELRQFYAALLPRLAALPGVTSAAIATHMPLSGRQLSLSVEVVGVPSTVENQRSAQHHGVSPSYFRTMGIPLEAGRLLTADDDRADAPPVVVVNQAFARAVFPDGRAVGRRITLGGADNPPREIVGVVGDVQMRSLEEEHRIATYAAFGKEPWPMVAVALRTGASTGIAAALRGAVHAVDGELAVGDITTMTRLVDDSLGERRLSTFLFGIFGAIALLLAVIGVYGVMSHSVAQRVQEIGIRIALGARPAQVRRQVLGRGLALAAAGVALGVGGAIALNRVVAGLLYGISSTDPLTYAAAAAVLLLIAGLAAWLPAHRAARVDPMVAMRSE